MCQEKETRCYTSKKPKTVYKVVIRNGNTFEAFFEWFTYAPFGEINRPAVIKLTEIEQTGYHCFLTKKDASTFIDWFDNGDKPCNIVKCTIPANESYRYGTFHISNTDKVKTLRATNIIIDKIVK